MWKVRQKLSFIISATALTESINIWASTSHLHLILTKQQGGLLTSSTAVSAVIDRCEKAFRVLVSGDTILKIKRHVRLIHLCVFCSYSPTKAVHMVEMVQTVDMLETAETAKIGEFLLFLLSPGDNVLPAYFASANQGSLLVTWLLSRTQLHGRPSCHIRIAAHWLADLYVPLRCVGLLCRDVTRVPDKLSLSRIEQPWTEFVSLEGSRGLGPSSWLESTATLRFVTLVLLDRTERYVVGSPVDNSKFLYCFGQLGWPVLEMESSPVPPCKIGVVPSTLCYVLSRSNSALFAAYQLTLQYLTYNSCNTTYVDSNVTFLACEVVVVCTNRSWLDNQAEPRSGRGFKWIFWAIAR